MVSSKPPAPAAKCDRKIAGGGVQCWQREGGRARAERLTAGDGYF